LISLAVGTAYVVYFNTELFEYVDGEGRCCCGCQLLYIPIELIAIDIFILYRQKPNNEEHELETLLKIQDIDKAFYTNPQRKV
jgi:hypothetical protein